MGVNRHIPSRTHTYTYAYAHTPEDTSEHTSQHTHQDTCEYTTVIKKKDSILLTHPSTHEENNKQNNYQYQYLEHTQLPIPGINQYLGTRENFNNSFS